MLDMLLVVLSETLWMGIEYPSLIEIWSRSLSVHQNHQGCNSGDTNYLADESCNASAHLWVGDVDDGGGWFASAYDDSNHVLPSFVIVGIVGLGARGPAEGPLTSWNRPLPGRGE